jgi:hypothetical protein
LVRGWAFRGSINPFLNSTQAVAGLFVLWFLKSLPHARSTLDFASIGHIPLRLGLGLRCMTGMTSRELDTPADEGMCVLILLHGIEATVPSADTARACRHALCDVDTARLGLKHLSCHSNSQGDAASS